MADVRVEDRLDLGRDGRLLLEAERLVLELGSLLRAGRGASQPGVALRDSAPRTFDTKGEDAHLGELEQLLGELLNLLELLDRLDAGADSLGVRRARRVEDVLDLLLVVEGDTERQSAL